MSPPARTPEPSSGAHHTIAPIVDVGWLQARPAEPDLVIADVRWYLDGRSGRDAYVAGHIPGAVFVDLDTVLAAEPSPELGRHPLPDPAVFAAGLAAAGIGAATTVVAYDDAGGMSAGRLVWLLRLLGRPAALLDGGIAAWDGPLAAGAATPTPAAEPLAAVAFPSDAFADADATAAAAADPAACVIDARAPERYRGETEPVDRRAGHIPGARNVAFASLRDATTGRFLEPSALRARFVAAGVTDAARTIVYCGSGVSACVDALALEHAGLGRPRLYPGSWSQWAADAHRPVATGEEAPA